MKYIIVVDKQSSSNPSSDKREYTIDIEELRTYNGISDTLTVTTEAAYVTRRLQLSEYGILSVLPAPKKEEIKDLNITLFEGENYIYILNAEGNKISLSYVIKNDFTDTYPTKADMKSSITQTAQSIELSVNQKLTGYATTQEMNSAISQSAQSITSSVNQILTNYATTDDLESEVTELNSTITQTASSITSEVNKKVNDSELGTKISQDWESVQIAWNQISQYIQFIDAMLQIKDSNNALLMTLDRYGQKFYENNVLLGLIGSTFYIEDNSQKGLAFNLEPNGKFMTWGKKDNVNDDSYMAKMFYCAPNSFGRNEEGIYFNVPIFLSDELKMDYGTFVQGSDWWPAVYISDNITNGFVKLSRYESDFECPNGVFINGYQVQTNTSDGRLKHDIKNTDINALDRIKQLKHRQFIWNKDNKQEQIGYIAQELEQVDENYVTKNPQYDEEGNVIDNLYQVNLLPILATATKAIQELEDKLEEKEKIINNQQELLQKLAEKVGLEDEYNTLFNSAIPKVAKAMKIEEDVVDYGTEIKRSTNFKKATPNKLIITKDGTVRKEKES